MTVGRKLRGAAGVLAALLFVGELATFVHAAKVEHSICAEHGETIDESADVGAAAPTATATDVDSLAKADTAADDEHDHCRLACAAPRLSAPTFRSLVSAVLDGIAALSGTGEVVPPAVPLHRLAPKNSPPSIG